jgi:hypothetical protein
VQNRLVLIRLARRGSDHLRVPRTYGVYAYRLRRAVSPNYFLQTCAHVRRFRQILIFSAHNSYFRINSGDLPVSSGGTEIVDPDDVEDLNWTRDAQLALVTYYRSFTWDRRAEALCCSGTADIMPAKSRR